MYYTRSIETKISSIKDEYAVITIYGARQVGKSTMVEHLFGNIKKVSMDNLELRTLANSNPMLFLETYGWPLVIDEVQKFAAFNFKGIFTCIEEAQPAIKVLRNTVNLWRNMDYTSSVINVYDNFQTIADGFTVCINAIFPPE